MAKQKKAATVSRGKKVVRDKNRVLEGRDRRIEELSLFLDIATTISSSLDLTDILLAVAEGMAKSVKVTFCHIYLLDETGKNLIIRAASPVRNLEWDPRIGHQYKLASLPSHQKVIRSGKPLLFSQVNPGSDTNEAELKTTLSNGTQSALIVPIMARTQPLGTLLLGEVRAWKRSPFSQEKIRLCQAIASQVAITIKNAQLYEQIKRLARTITKMGELTGGIAHEIKNPLFAISSGIQVLESELKLDEEQKETFGIIFQETMRAGRMVKQLLNYTDRQELKRTPLQITTVINGVVSLNRGLLRSRGIKVRRTLPDDMPPIQADRDRIIQVLVNLLQNAIDVSRKGDTIELNCGIDGDRQSVVIQVKDRGPGIPEEQRERVFDLFFSTKKGGSGMGLAISKRIVLEHGGNIRVELRKRGGTTFVVELPLGERKDSRVQGFKDSSVCPPSFDRLRTC